jgi:hypothetical protein
MCIIFYTFGQQKYYLIYIYVKLLILFHLKCRYETRLLLYIYFLFLYELLNGVVIINCHEKRLKYILFHNTYKSNANIRITKTAAKTI